MNTQVLSIHKRTALTQARQLLDQGQALVAPTDTVYGVMCRYDNADAIASLYEIKDRPPQKAIPVLIADTTQLATLTPLPITPVARALMEHFWPGALTIVLPALPTLPPILTAGQPSVAVRMPAYKPLLALIRQSGPLAATSANRSGQPDTRTVAEVLAQLNERVALVLQGDDGQTVGEPSTVIDVSRAQEFPRILRRGPLAGAINNVLYTIFGYAC